MRARIHRGAAEIGGSCIEVEAGGGERLVLDVGRPLSAGWGDDVELPAVSGLAEPDPSLLAVLLSHPHLDHYGLIDQVGDHVPVYIGAEAEALLDAAAFFSPMTVAFESAGNLRHREPFAIGPFGITPFLNDHSAFDAYSLLIEADGRRLFYTGDFRGHGRKAKLFEQLLADPPPVDTLLMEGTHVRADGTHDEAEFETEAELEQRLLERIQETAGAVVVLGSAQNLDRLVTVYRAAKRSDRQLVVDLYGATVAAATRASIPQPGHDILRVWVPQRQRVKVKQAEEFERVDWIRDCRVFKEEPAADPGGFVFHVPSSSAPQLIRDKVLDQTGLAAWSLWGGYLDQPSGRRLTSELAAAGVPLEPFHTSGHASVKDLGRLVDAIAPGCVVPIHSEATNRFSELFPGVTHRADGEWWEI